MHYDNSTFMTVDGTLFWVRLCEPHRLAGRCTLPMGRPMRLLRKRHKSTSQLVGRALVGGCEKTSHNSPWPAIKIALLVSMMRAQNVGVNQS